MPILTVPEDRDVNKVFQSEVALDLSAVWACVIIVDVAESVRVAFE